jgi:N-acetylmuramoyl-L-alanine amidase
MAAVRYLTDLWYHTRLAWYTADKEACVFVTLICGFLTVLGFAMQAVLAHQDDRRNVTREVQVRELACLARNVYYEARGEPVAGQYAVAEVTMNRKASRHYPKTVCEVVHEKNWDPIRKRYVGAFSWTEFDSLPEPSGEEWDLARKIAEAVYHGRALPTMQGALFFHATYIKPDWAKEKKRIARIGRHVFYR